jgi:hypothetical protein
MAATLPVCFLVIVTGLIAGSFPSHAAVGVDVNSPPANAFQVKVTALLNQLPPPQVHYAGIPEAEAASRLRREQNYEAFVREKLQSNWFAALTDARADESYSIQGRFETWKGLMDFLVERDALVEVWAYPEAGKKPRRIPSTEMAVLKQQQREQPVFITITYRGDDGLVTNRVEFSFKAASEVLAASIGYRRHRDLQIAAREVLGSRDERGKLNATTQWDALAKATQSGRLPLTELPPKPTNSANLFVAFEYEVDAFNNFTNAARVYRESEIERRVVEDSTNSSAQVLLLKKTGEQRTNEVRSFRVRGLSDELEPAPNPVPGQDVVELRVKNPNEPDVRRWNVLDFGEPALVEQSALAKFSLISAHLEKKRKEIAIKKSNLDLIAEPIFAGLNIGGGLAGVGFPIGAAARLGYDVAVVPWLIPDVPSVKEMRELFRLMAAKDKDPALKTKPGHFLDEADFKHLQESAKDLTEGDVVEYLQRVSDDDLKGMLRLAKMQRIDAKVSNLLSIVADAGKVSGWTDEPGLQRDVFNSIYFSVTGEINIKNIIAVLADGEVATPKSGLSLEDLSKGRGPSEAWLQYLDFTVDIRAVVNTVARLSHRSLADKELKKPFPYAPRMTDIAAYEIRVFGFPLLMFYKRGLLKDDQAAYLNDYAYGLIGATIVEHFRTREELDEEIRAGRMVPLGYVRVFDGKGKWKETNLAVFGHRIRNGRHKGKTAVVIYGLKAYEQQSQFVEREYLRFKKFEQALREGGVIEQLVDAENREQLPSQAFEPTLHVGADAGEKIYAPLLGGMQELHRYWRRQSWGIPFDTHEVDLVAGAFENFAAKDIWVEDRDPLVGVERFNSTFRYRKSVGGKWRVTQMTLIPNRTDIERELAKASEGERIEKLRQEAVSDRGEGVVLLNTAKQVNGRYEIGPLLQDEKGEVIGAGIRPGVKAMEEMFDRINLFSVADRARLEFNNFAATVVELDLAGNGRTEKVFLTIEFPLDKKFARAWTNPLSGERENLNFEKGHLISVITERRVTEIDYAKDNREQASRTYFNAGTREQPVKGALMEETRTLETWFRNLSQPDLDPYQPRLAKLKVNHVTGQMSRETYGLFPLPVSTVDDQFITETKFNALGIFASARVVENGATDADFQRPLFEKLTQPISGSERFVLVSTIPQAELTALRDLKAQGYRTSIERKDVVKGLTRTTIFDNARGGRKASESYVDAFDGTTPFALNSAIEYRDDFFFGLVPARTQLRSGSGALLSEVNVQSVDPLSRRLIGIEMDATGRAITNLWDYRWENPVSAETELRRTTNQFDRLEVSLAGTTISKSSSEAVGEFSGRFDADSRRWSMVRNIFHRPGISKRTETNVLSGFGKLISTRVGDLFESRPVYNADGIETARSVARKNPANGQFDLLHRLEEDYQWQKGERSALIHIFVDGQPYDVFRSLTDAEGRTTVDRIRQIPGCELRTVLTYSGGSERIVSAEEFQNGTKRAAYIAQPEQQRPDGSWLLPVAAVPAAGLTITQTFLINDLLARPLMTVCENGESTQVTEWFEATSIAKVSELIDRQGQPKERFVKSLNRGTEGAIPFDLTAHYQLSRWGTAALAEAEASIRGTDVALFKSGVEGKTYYDLSQQLKVPASTVDPQNQGGIEVMLRNARKPHVLTVFSSRMIQYSNSRGATPRREPVLELEAVDLRGLFYHKVTRQIVDASGKILEEVVGRIPNLAATAYTDAALFEAVARMKPTKKFFYHYERGWLVEKTDPESGGRVLLFQDKPEGKSFAVNEGPGREFATRIDGAQVISEPTADDPFNPAAATAYFFRRIHSPRALERNPYMPKRSDVWTAWTATDLGTDGRPLFDAETIYDAQGQLSVSKANKTTGGNKPATKTAFHLPSPAPGMLQERAFDRGGQSVQLEQQGQTDFSTSDFVYFYTANPSNALQRITVADTSGTTVRVTKGNSDYRQRIIAQWPIGSANVRWLPDAIIPRQGLVVDAPASLLKDDQVVVISAHDLARAGLNLQRVSSVQVDFEGRQDVSLSPLFSLSSGEPWIADPGRKEFSFEEHHHFNRLKTSALAPRGLNEREILAGQGLNSVSEFHGLPIVITRPTAAHSEYPHSIVVDNSDVDSSRPLYALSPRDGHFLQHYKTLKLGDAQVYTVVQGFEVPRVEVFNARALSDEIAPEFMAYGSDYAVTIQYARGRGTIGAALAGLHNRIAANAFTFSGDRLARSFRADDSALQSLSGFNYASLHDVHRQAEEINELPMLAAALLPNRELPWTGSPLTDANVSTQEWSSVRRALTEASRLHLEDYPSGLISTAPGTAAERYVDTVQEAGVIILATKVGDYGLAKGLLEFYWNKSEGGQKALHAAYDAQAGTAKSAEPTFERSPPALRTAEAQLAIADAAFILGLQTADSKWLTMGSNLTHLLFRDFRPPPITNGAPRGFCEHQFLPATNVFGITLWPRAQLFSLRSNARAYLLLKQLQDVLGRRSADRFWRFHITEALREQEAWLRTYIVPQVEKTGVVPKGLFEIQDINQGTVALGVERWTSAEGWLAFLEAADAMGISQETTRGWLENLARVHGVRVNNAWGLDWSVPLLRADVISSEATAQFQRVAKLIGHQPAERFAQQNLNLLKTSGGFPVIATAARADRALPSGQGFFILPRINHQGWPLTFGADKEMAGPRWDSATAQGPLETKSLDDVWPPRRTDLTVFVLITASFYLFILVSAIFWWRFRALRQREHAKVFPDPLVPDPVMHCAEERWARRVLGVQTPDGAENTRFSNAALEQNFLLQLKAIYQFVLEWRRHENHWVQNDPRLIEGGDDPWINGLDEFATMVGLYMRWVIKAGAKDGFSKPDVLAENEDSNHIWSRLVIFLSEHYWGVLTLMRNYQNVVTRRERRSMYAQFSQVLGSLGIRQRAESFDARKLFDFPADPAAMDLMAIQRPGMTLDKLAAELSERLSIPREHFVEFVRHYKEFKKRESPDPIHPYLIEFAKVMPHFLLMGLGALIWYNQRTGDSPIVPYLWSVLTQFALTPASVIWVLPLFAGMVLSFVAHWVRVYRFEAPMLVREKTELFLDATLTSIFAKPPAQTTETASEKSKTIQSSEESSISMRVENTERLDKGTGFEVNAPSVMPEARTGRRWNPRLYQRAGWALRVFGFVYLAITLFRLETPSFATFLIMKGLLAMPAVAEVAAIILPLAGTVVSKFLQDRVTSRTHVWPITKFVNRLNITATKPASPLWLTLKYHAQPSVPTGDFWGMLQAIVFYFVFAATFFFVGGFLCQQIFSLWFTDTYLQAADWKLFFGALLFWNTMYLLRYGLFLMFSGVASLLATFPIQGAIGLLAVGQWVLAALGRRLNMDVTSFSGVIYFLMGIALLLIFFGKPITTWLKNSFSVRSSTERSDEKIQKELAEIKEKKNATLGVVYMSGDDLAFQKLKPDLLMARWAILRDKLDSAGLGLLAGMTNRPDDATLKKWFEDLYEAEKASDVTLWHPMQIVVGNETPALNSDLELNLAVENQQRRNQLLTAWHLRRWLVTMMSTAGHSQDTAINLVDIALRLNKEGLGANTVFYLIQNKYDNNENNRPSQTPYRTGELNQRNKLARLLKAVAPGARAYSVHDWTPFGFKAGALTGMDMVHEESLNLTTMLLLDRNATVHDLDALMRDLGQALTDPDVVIIVPGRGTTNTLTSVGQGSQMVEEGHRSFLKGLMAMLGGSASESVGTGWGNILAVSYGRVLRALVDSHSAKMPLTSRMQRGSSFAVRAEGLIGFAPHAVGISEDIWAVCQTAHNSMALGRRVKFLLSTAMWHKIRETWSHSEWLASFPRWSGGYLQMMHDPLMQRIVDFGPQSVFAKEVRANSGRNFLSAPFALLNILLLPLAIMLDVTPFIQILILLWNFGFIMNQILTVHGLNSYLEGAGFYRIPALIGAVVAGLMPLLFERLVPYTPGLILLGCLTGGFLVGLSRWLYTRVRDIILFGPQLVLHALGQVVRQSLEFVVSGASPQDAQGVNMAFRAWAGPREDRPLDTYPNLINLKTVIWLVGLLAIVLNLFALANLDMLNVLLLLPSLLFSVSMLIGPFIMRPRSGKPLGKQAVVPQALGWLAALSFFILVSMLVAAEGWFNWIALLIFSLVFALLLRQALKFALYRHKLRRLNTKLITLLSPFGTASETARRTQQILEHALSHKAQVRAELAGLPAPQQETVLGLIEREIHPLLIAPARGAETTPTARRRWRSEFGRSFTLAVFILLWFFIVPVPGLLVFTAGAYRFSVGLGTILMLIVGTIGFVLIFFWIGKLIQWLDRIGTGGRGLRQRAENAYYALQSVLANPDKLSRPELASTFALFTDVQTYFDQRSYAYARRSLGLIERNLEHLSIEPSSG